MPGIMTKAAIHQIIPLIPRLVLSKSQPPTAELMALDRVNIANSLEKTLPRTLSGTHSSKSWVEKVQLIPPPNPRMKVPSSTRAKLARGAVNANPITPIP